MTLNLLSTIFTKNKLNGDNYVDWKCNLDIVLKTKKHNWVLDIECRTSPRISFSNEKLLVYKRWKTSDQFAKNMIMMETDHNMQPIIDWNKSASEIIKDLKERSID